MALVGSILGWIFSILFCILAISMFLTGNTVRGIILLVAILLLLPPIQILIKSLSGQTIPAWARIVGAVVMVGLFAWMMARDEKTSIYFSPEIQARMMAIYDAKLAQWPTPYETRYVDTAYGKVHVIISGSDEAPPMLLLNAGQMAGWSWMTNVGLWNNEYRTYAIDTIGEPGKSELSDIHHFPRNGREWSDLLVEITNKLGVEKAFVVGASNGGFLALNYAIHYPERIEKLALLGSMGLTPSTNENIMRITFSQMFPLKWVQDNTIRWSFGDDPALHAQIDEWFRLVFQTAPQQSPPITMKAGELQQVKLPTLAVLGTKDNLMGDLEAVRELASNVPVIEIVEVEASHLMGIEQPEKCSQLILEFFGTNLLFEDFPLENPARGSITTGRSMI
jgi:pimeloyl-ACP methyl ester carboxylesterase